MSALDAIGMKALRALEPEKAHHAAITGLRAGLGPRWNGPFAGRLRAAAMGLDFKHPIGLAAGFDKNAEAVAPLYRAGFGFIEIGAVTPHAQPGNPRPRLFRLTEDRAAINRFGFNNDGLTAIRERLETAPRKGPLGVNLGANKDSVDRAADYVAVLEGLYDTADFFTVNVSSPNTERLRDLQGRAALDALLTRVLEARDARAQRKPVLLKIAPDLTPDERADIAEVCLERGIDGIIATNTSSGLRDALRDPQRMQGGGLSGAPIMGRSTMVLRDIRRLTEGRIPLIGVGGVASAADAYAKIRAGASLVQLYTALIYAGPGLLREIVEGLDRLLEQDGFATVAEAVGMDA